MARLHSSFLSYKSPRFPAGLARVIGSEAGTGIATGMWLLSGVNAA